MLNDDVLSVVVVLVVLQSGNMALISFPFSLFFS